MTLDKITYKVAYLPRWVSPFVASTSNTPLSIVNRDTSKVPPPRSKTRMFISPAFLSRPYAIAAAVLKNHQHNA